MPSRRRHDAVTNTEAEKTAASAVRVPLPDEAATAAIIGERLPHTRSHLDR
jgi:hypothetical protein